MTATDRRNIIMGTIAAATLARPALAQPQQGGGDSQAASATAPGTAPKGSAPPPVTRIIARYAASAPADQVPEAVRKEATRTLLNWVGCAVGGSRQDAPGRAVAALKPFSGPEQACLFGRAATLPIDHAVTRCVHQST